MKLVASVMVMKTRKNIILKGNFLGEVRHALSLGMRVTRIKIEQNVQREISDRGFKVGLEGQAINAFGWVTIVCYFFLSFAVNEDKAKNVSDLGFS